jgi:hypothetical protein
MDSIQPSTRRKGRRKIFGCESADEKWEGEDEVESLSDEEDSAFWEEAWRWE